MDALKYKTTIKDGQLDLPPLDLPEGTIVEAILLINKNISIDQDETEYLLSTEANRQHLLKALQSLNNPQDYVYIDPSSL